MNISQEERIFIDILDSYQDEMAKNLSNFLRLPSVEGQKEKDAPFGKDIAKALTYILELSQAWGFQCTNLDGYVGLVDYNFSADLPQEQLGILTHLDVVPAGKGWTHPPFAGDLAEGIIYGRGAVDDKGPLMAALYSMRAIKESGLPLRRSIRHIMGTNEESGFACMEYFLKNCRPPDFGFTPDGSFPLIYGEKGIIHCDLQTDMENLVADSCLLSLQAGNAPNMVPDEAEAALKGEDIDFWRDKLQNYPHGEAITLQEENSLLIIRAQGQSAHGSTPEYGLNALAVLLQFLLWAKKDDPLMAVLREAYELFCQYHKGCGCNLACADEHGSLTMVPTIMRTDGKKIKICLDIRFPISSSCDKIKEKLLQGLQGHCWEIVNFQGKEPLYLSTQHALIKSLLKVYQDMTGDDSPPIAIGGGTYARTMKNFIAFGPGFPRKDYPAHQGDESISVEDLLLLSKIYAVAAYRLAR
ncbi:MAG: dipeptidase PepV [Clostridiales bacterium]